MTEHKTIALNFLYLPLTIMINAVDGNQLMILGWMIILDFVTGIGKSYRLNIIISKKRMIDGIILKTVIFIIPLVIALLSKGLGLDAKDYLFWIISILIVAEAYGVLGNILSIKNKKEVEEKDLVNMLLHGLRGLLIRYLTFNDKNLK